MIFLLWGQNWLEGVLMCKLVRQGLHRSSFRGVGAKGQGWVDGGSKFTESN